jgi:hypothetical protein
VLSDGAWVTFDLKQVRAKGGFALSGAYGTHASKLMGGSGWSEGSLRGSNFNVEIRDETAGNMWLQRFEGVISPAGKLSGTVPESMVLIRGHWDKYKAPAMLTFYAGRQAECQKTSAEAEVEEKQQGGAGEVLKQTTPPSAEEKTGVFEEKPHKGIGGILKETQP